jgi:hypothetical protein
MQNAADHAPIVDTPGNLNLQGFLSHRWRHEPARGR